MRSCSSIRWLRRSCGGAGFRWILPIIQLQLVVKFRVQLLELLWLLEEILGHHGEELGGIGRPVLVEEGRSVGIGGLGQRLVFPAENPRPRPIHGRPRQRRGAVHKPVFTVELMGELVEGDVSSAARVRGAMKDVVPRDDHSAGPPGFADAPFVGFDNLVVRPPLSDADEVGIGVDQDRLEPGIIVVRLDVQQEDARVGGNGDLDLIGHFEAATALEVFLSDEDLDGFPQFLLLGPGQPLVVGDVALDDGQPGRGERLRPEAMTASGLESEHGQSIETNIARFRGDGGDQEANFAVASEVGYARFGGNTMTELILMAHVLFGVACIVAAVWIFVDVLHASETNQARIRRMCWAAAVFMWLAFCIAGYWYVVFYKVDKSIILKGPWPFAHSFFMETKEHLVIMLLVLVTYLPIAASNNLTANKDARRVVLWVAGMIALIALMMEGEGAIIAMGVKVALLAK